MLSRESRLRWLQLPWLELFALVFPILVVGGAAAYGFSHARYGDPDLTRVSRAFASPQRLALYRTITAAFVWAALGLTAIGALAVVLRAIVATWLPRTRSRIEVWTGAAKWLLYLCCCVGATLAVPACVGNDSLDGTICMGLVTGVIGLVAAYAVAR
ncbi:MAG TPA: hypothetical protein VN903_16100 [Polyangia bacterium]|nr:hypothetical protein [Polyangia bacterium]